jgi:hypothetical protein
MAAVAVRLASLILFVSRVQRLDRTDIGRYNECTSQWVYGLGKVVFATRQGLMEVQRRGITEVG